MISEEWGGWQNKVQMKWENCKNICYNNSLMKNLDLQPVPFQRTNNQRSMNYILNSYLSIMHHLIVVISTVISLFPIRNIYYNQHHQHQPTLACHQDQKTDSFTYLLAILPKYLLPLD